MPDRFSEYKKDDRKLFDNKKAFDRKLKQMTKFAKQINNEYVKLKIVGEEFIKGVWIPINCYPEDS